MVCDLGPGAPEKANPFLDWEEVCVCEGIVFRAKEGDVGGLGGLVVDVADRDGYIGGSGKH